jgi:hypothetical protein
MLAGEHPSETANSTIWPDTDGVPRPAQRGPRPVKRTVGTDHQEPPNIKFFNGLKYFSRKYLHFTEKS